MPCLKAEMQVYDYSEFVQNMPSVFNTALFDEVEIDTPEGNSYKLAPMHKESTAEKSPLEDIPGIKTTATMQDIVEMLHESHAGI
jgi:hypothetical protein